MSDLKESSTKVETSAFTVGTFPIDLEVIVVAARVKRHWSQARLAAKAKVARASVYRLEGGGRAIRPDTVFRIAHALGLDRRDLVPAWPEWDPLTAADHGPRTRERRRELGLTAAALATAAGVSEATLSRYEPGIGCSRALIKRVGERHYACNEGVARALQFRNLVEFEEYCLNSRAPISFGSAS